METNNASELLAALGHETRLAIFRLLIQAGPAGLSAGELGDKLDLPGPTLSFHLSHLSRCGLIDGRKQSRYIYYSANFSLMNDLVAFLTHNCCGGEPCTPTTLQCEETE
ncbi:metalloregulator ArsR/SmtB family transcription factor [Hahella sp. SMD15-11]|uniref:Metalloregulator ArsR/SmtB family transcription factor n=1 Tax=Thermohahella caldifontis TaxID=3142973 RepID=A0AB39UWR7_9GAMM